MDWNVYEGSAIERLPKIVRPAALIARHAKMRLFPEKPHHRSDGIATRHNDGFHDTPAFRKAYARAVDAAGADFGIPYRVHQALWCARTASSVGGAFVELGTGRGFIMSAIMEDTQTRRPVHLFDTFLPAYPRLSGEQIGPASPYYAASFDRTRANFAEWPNVTLHQGDAFKTLPAAHLGDVAFLHVDMNHPDPEVFGIRTLWPKMPKGAVMLLDDYAHADHHVQYCAINALADELGFSVLSTPTGQGIVVK